MPMEGYYKSSMNAPKEKTAPSPWPGDTATTKQTDIPGYMKPDMQRVAGTPVSEQSMPKETGVVTPGYPDR